MHTIEIDAGTLTASRDTRTVTGLLLPYGEPCRSNLGMFSVDPGVMSIPADLTGMSLNVEHQRERVIGSPVSMRETDKGIVATFSIARTPEGDAALNEIEAGTRKHLSVEAAEMKIKDGKATAGKLFAAALVKVPAFPSATLLAAAADTVLAEEVAVSDSSYVSEYTDEAGVTWRRVEQYQSSTDQTQGEDGSTVTTSTSSTTVTEEPIAAEEQQENEEDAAMALPNTLTAGKASAAAATTEPRPVHLPSLFASINRARFRQATDEDMLLLAAATPGVLAGDPEKVAKTLMAALSDITISGAGSLPVGAGAIQPNWVGQLNQGITYKRKYVPIAKTGTDITAEGKKGYQVHLGTEAAPVNDYAQAGRWAGNKAAIGSGNGFTVSAQSVLHKFALGNDIGREFFDLPGGAEVLAAYFSRLKESHLMWSDEFAKLAWIDMAGVPVAKSTAIPTDYPATLGMVMQAILAVNKEKADKRSDKASFVIVNDEAAEQLSFTPFEKIPNYVKFSWNLDGSGLVDGDVVVVKGDMGIVGSPAVLGGASYALELDELPGGPLWIDALNIAQGGIDRAIHGYLQEFQVRPEAVKMIGDPEARANATAYPEGRIIKVAAVIYRVVVAGTTGGAAPTAPAVGATVVDGSATLLRLA